jgi:hypothetical protein
MIMQKESKTPTTHLTHVGLGATKTNNPKKVRTHINARNPKTKYKIALNSGPTNSLINSKNFFMNLFFNYRISTTYLYGFGFSRCTFILKCYAPINLLI